MSRFAFTANDFAQGTQLGQQRTLAAAAQAAQMLDQQFAQQQALEQAEERKRLFAERMAQTREEKRQRDADGRIAVLMQNNLPIDDDTLMSASDNWRRIAADPAGANVRGANARSMWESLKTTPAKISRLDPKAKEEIRRFVPEAAGAFIDADARDNLHDAEAFGYSVADELAAAGVQIAPAEHSALLSNLQRAAETMPRDSFLNFMDRQITSARDAWTLRHQKMLQAEALRQFQETGDVSGVVGQLPFGQGVKVVQGQREAKDKLAQVTNDQNTLAQLLESAGVPKENATRIASLSAGARGTAIDVLNRNEDAAAAQADDAGGAAAEFVKSFQVSGKESFEQINAQKSIAEQQLQSLQDEAKLTGSEKEMRPLIEQQLQRVQYLQNRASGAAGTMTSKAAPVSTSAYATLASRVKANPRDMSIAADAAAQFEQDTGRKPSVDELDSLLAKLGVP